MKKILFYAASLALLASCASDEIVDTTIPNGSAGNSPITFVMGQKNMTRSYSALQETHYNFGVFAYKSTDKVNSVMPNYLVGYYDDAKAYQKTGTTVGDKEEQVDGLSYWMYEGMGNAEYMGTYAGAAITDAFKSNNANQYLKYWDNAADATYFYAYAPYINGAGTATYVDGTAQSATGSDTYVLTIPNGTLVDGYDDPTLAEYMYASAKVVKANYGHDVALQFKRLNAKVNIKFWEDIPGYKVRIVDLGNGHEGVKAAASIKEAGKGDFGYKGGKYYTANGVKIKFNDGAYQSMKQFEGTLAEPTVADGNNATTLNFKSPTESAIGENRYAAVSSPTTYYAIPKGDGANVLADGNTDFTTDQACDADLAKTGFTFHVSYELTAEDTGEKIVVKNATVHVPFEYANWKNNTHYTYIFKITKNTNGSTDVDDDPNIDPTDPEVPVTPALYPIIFDNCTVEDWEENESEWNISDAEGPIYHDVQLSTYSLVSGDITVTVTDNDTYAGHGINLANVTVTPTDANISYDGAGTIHVGAGAAPGVYTVTYTCPATGDQTTHPATWTETFLVGSEYTVALNLTTVGTHGLADSKLTITPKQDGTVVTPTAGQLYIDYPANFTDDQKKNVAVSGTEIIVKKEATPGTYKLVYKVSEPSVTKVEEVVFEVKDFQHSLSTNVIKLNNGGSLTVNKNGTDDAITLDDAVVSAGKITISGNTINVANDCPEGTYNVYYTVNRTDAASIVTYLKSFEVKNTYSVAVSKTSVDRNVGTSNAGDTSSDIITVTLKKNGEATTTDLTSSLVAVKADGSAVAEGAIYFQYDGGTAGLDTYYLRVTNNVPAGNYKVVYTGQTGVTAEAGFVVTE